MSVVHESECKAAGLDPREVAKLAQRLEKAAKDAERMGLTVFGGAHSGDLRTRLESDDFTDGPVIVAAMNGSWDGGDGGCVEGKDGLLRGEGA